MIVSVSLYHDRAICGTLCLSNVGDESFFVGMKGKTDAEWMQKGMGHAGYSQHSSLPFPPMHLLSFSRPQGGGTLQITSLGLLCPLVSSWVSSMKVTCKRLKSERSLHFFPSPSLLQHHRLSTCTWVLARQLLCPNFSSHWILQNCFAPLAP